MCLLVLFSLLHLISYLYLFVLGRNLDTNLVVSIRSFNSGGSLK